MEGKLILAPFLLLVLALVLEYKVTSADVCASSPILINSSTTGKFSSPNYPNNYPHNANKTWKIVAPIGQVIDLYFPVFSLERSSSCLNDSVKIRGKCDDTVPMAVYCDHTARPLRSSSNVLWIEFRSDHSVGSKGFEAIYTMNSNASKLISCPSPSDNQANIDYCLNGDQVQCCNKNDSKCWVNAILTAENGTITSPGYPEYYPHGLFYLWRITVPEGYVVQINFTTLITQHSASCDNAKSKCNCDYVQVLDGPCPFYNIGTKWCGAWTSRYIYPSYITTGRHMVLLFRSDLTNNHVGFVARYRRALNCSGDKPISCVKNSQASCCVREARTCLTQTSIRSHCPRDGDPANHDACCIVNGQASCCVREAFPCSSETSVRSHCPRNGDPASHDTCCIVNGQASCCITKASICSSQSSIRSHCPRNGDPASFIGCCTVNRSPSCCPVLQSGNNISCPRSSDNHAFIDVCLNGGQQICCNRNLPACRYNTLLTDPNGVITSPGYPSSYPPNSLVVWRITVPEGFLVQINFTTLKINKGFSCSSCNCDYVAVRDGPCSNIDGIKWCGSSRNRLPSFVSTGRHLQVVFKSDQWRSDDGFVARYRRALKCGGETPYSCLNNGEPACCKTQGASLVSTSTKLWITMVIMTTALLLM